MKKKTINNNIQVSSRNMSFNENIRGVMEDAITCSICSEEYKSGVYDPLILPCGHTFCRKCLINIKKSKNVSCPTCRERHDGTDIESLAMNYSILSLSENFTHFKPQTCNTHGKLLDLWCKHCRVVVCGLCIVQDHRQEVHEIVSAQDQLSAMKMSLKNQEDFLNEMILYKKTELNQQAQQTVVSLLHTLRDQKELKSLSYLVSKMSEEAYKSTNVESLEIYQAKFSSLHSSITSSLEHEVSKESKSASKDTNQDINKTKNIEENRKNASAVLSISGSLARDSPFPLSICVTDNAKRSALITWEDNKFLLSAFQEEAFDNHIILQWSVVHMLLSNKTPDAFMELAIGEHYLGRVYFRVWGRLRRAQHFLALCMGTLGPSYKGGVFRSSHKDESKERICGCVYKTADGTLSTKGLMENLEWDGEYAGKSYEGLVVGTSGGRSDMDALFSIYTKVKTKATCFCPFGEVISGLDVVKKALDHDPVSAVMINRCGIVLEI